MLELVIGAVGIFVGLGVGLWQSHHARQAANEQITHAKEQIRIAEAQLRLAELEHVRLEPGGTDLMLNGVELNHDQNVIGMYEGHSWDNKMTKSGCIPVDTAKHLDQFTISGQGGKLTIVGTSFDLATGAQASVWSGAVWHRDHDGTLVFGLRVTYRGRPELGNLSLNFRGDIAEGFYYSGDPGNKFINSVKAQKVDRFSGIGGGLSLSPEATHVPR